MGALLQKVIKEKVQKLKADGEVDLIAGGPPCQGFSTAGRRNAADSRNSMPWYFLEFVELFCPKFVLIENVTGIRMKFAGKDGNSVAETLRKSLEGVAPGYDCQILLLNAQHYGAPQYRPRTVIVGVRDDVAKKLEISDLQPFWKSAWAGPRVRETYPPLAPRPIRAKERRSVGQAFADLNNVGYLTPKPRGEYSTEMRTLRTVPAGQRPEGLVNHKLREHCDRVEQRFRLYQVLRAHRLNEELVMYAAKHEAYTRAGLRSLLRSEMEKIGNSISFPMRSPDGDLVITSEEALVDLLVELKTKKHSQRALVKTETFPTIMTLPDDLVHYEHPRTLTVREMARLQSFPDSFEFRGKETTGGKRRRVEVPQYSQVGNAVPPLLAEAIARQFRKLLKALSWYRPHLLN